MPLHHNRARLLASHAPLPVRPRAADGTPVPGEALLPALGLSDERSTDWTFVTQDMHPVTDTPFYVLHPCRTAQRMGELAAADNSGDKAGGSVASAPYLLSWFCATVAAINLHMGPDEFAAVSSAMWAA